MSHFDFKTQTNHGVFKNNFLASRINQSFWYNPDLMTVTFIGSAFGCWHACLAVKSALKYESLLRALGVVIIVVNSCFF